jgi:hypothetical protein
VKKIARGSAQLDGGHFIGFAQISSF